MEKLGQHIPHLLWGNGSASVPGAGILTLHRVSGVMDGDRISAPGYSVSFERSEVNEDRTLVSSLARASKMSEVDAAKKVAEVSEVFAQALLSSKGIEIDSVGTLRTDANSGEIEFAPAAAVMSASSWLKPIALEPIEIKKTQEAKVAAAADALANRREALARSLRRTASSAAAIAVFALIAFVVSQLPVRNTRQQQVASLGIENLASSVHAEKQLPTTPEAVEPALVLVLNTPADGTSPAKVRKRHNADGEPKATADRYCLVVASLSSRAEADSYIKAHSTTEFPLSLLDADGRWRVFAISGRTYDIVSASARNTGIYERYPSAWICRR